MVTLVADLILAEEEADSEEATSICSGQSHPHGLRGPSSQSSGLGIARDWQPCLEEPLDLRLPLLLPEDCYPSDVPVYLNSITSLKNPQSQQSVCYIPGSCITFDHICATRDVIRPSLRLGRRGVTTTVEQTFGQRVGFTRLFDELLCGVKNGEPH
ncbi:unnamed protein product [Protopolystoma xenopodis]|uniref:Uncharacterized protein n=1 Tax=Protopolystoma xenopodis TaxID=117903 RepID=A0A3S5BSC0_9PLAT|nr:unnamed protein product [Protopolystoma xenopodis]